MAVGDNKTIVKNPLTDGLGPYDPSRGIKREKQLRNVALGTAIGNVFRNMLDLKGASQGAPISPITSNRVALNKYNEAIERNISRGDQLNALRLQETIRRGAEDRQYGRLQETEIRGENRTIAREGRGIERQIAGEGRAETRQIATEGRGVERTIAGEGRGIERQMAGEVRAETRQVTTEGRQETYRRTAEAVSQRNSLEQIAARAAEMQKLESVRQKTRNGFIDLWAPGTDGALQYVGEIPEGFAHELVNEILKDPSLQDEFDILKATWSGVSNMDVKLLISRYWDRVSHLVYGRQPGQEIQEPVDATNPGNLKGLGQTSKERRKAQKEAVNQIGQFDQLFLDGKQPVK